MGLKPLRIPGRHHSCPSNEHQNQEYKNDAFIRWLKGRKLTVADKKGLTVSGWSPIDISNSSLAIRFLNQFACRAQKTSVCVMALSYCSTNLKRFSRGISRSRQTRYAQDLRHLWMTSLNESVYFVALANYSREPNDLGKYPAIERQLGL